MVILHYRRERRSRLMPIRETRNTHVANRHREVQKQQLMVHRVFILCFVLSSSQCHCQFPPASPFWRRPHRWNRQQEWKFDVDEKASLSSPQDRCKSLEAVFSRVERRIPCSRALDQLLGRCLNMHSFYLSWPSVYSRCSAYLQLVWLRLGGWPLVASSVTEFVSV
jgi:hypothetical protein